MGQFKERFSGGGLNCIVSDDGFLRLEDDDTGHQISLGVETGDRIQALLNAIEKSQEITDKLRE